MQPPRPCRTCRTCGSYGGRFRCATCCTRSTSGAGCSTSGRAHDGAAGRVCCSIRVSSASVRAAGSAQSSGRLWFRSRWLRRSRSGVIYHGNLIGIADVASAGVLGGRGNSLIPSTGGCGKCSSCILLFIRGWGLHWIGGTAWSGIFIAASESAAAPAPILAGRATLGSRTGWALATLAPFRNIINIAGDVAVKVIVSVLIIILIGATKPGEGSTDGPSYQLIGLADSNTPVSYTHLTLPTNREV
mgnify:CR=1 FL=1